MIYYVESNVNQTSSKTSFHDDFRPQQDEVNASSLTDLIEWDGDMLLTKEMILTNFDFNVTGGEEFLQNILGENETAHEKFSAAPADGVINLWEDHTIYYSIRPPTSNNKRKEIRRAMDRWERDTCLRFLPVRSKKDDYIEIVTSEGGSCNSQVGRNGGKQFIYLQPHCSYGLTLHELGHVIGFFHEHDRPDRDKYIGLRRFSPKRSEYIVDSRGSPYDYRSVMHYPADYGRKPGCHGDECITITIENLTEYRHQGSPRLGYFSLSEEDTKQANRMYSCPQKGVRGFLSFQVKYGHSLPSASWTWNPVVVFTIVDATGHNIVRRTSRLLHTLHFSPVAWNELILVGDNEWQFFSMRARDSDTGVVITAPQTVLLRGGSYRDLKHCENLACHGYVIFDYFLDTRTVSNAELVIHIQSANKLSVNAQGSGSYVRIEAVLSSSRLRTKTTKTIYGDASPAWDERINFGCGLWNSFLIQMLGERSGEDLNLSNREWVWAYSGIQSNLVHNVHGDTHLLYGYHLNTDSQHCK